MIAGLKKIARGLKSEVMALWLAARDPRTPLAAKVVAAAVTAYALSPIDLIPDFIPVLGLLDDLIIVPAGIWLAIQLIPPVLMDEFRARATQLQKKASRVGLVVIATVWAACLYFIFVWIASLRSQ